MQINFCSGSFEHWSKCQSRHTLNCDKWRKYIYNPNSSHESQDRLTFAWLSGRSGVRAWWIPFRVGFLEMWESLHLKVDEPCVVNCVLHALKYISITYALSLFLTKSAFLASQSTQNLECLKRCTHYKKPKIGHRLVCVVLYSVPTASFRAVKEWHCSLFVRPFREKLAFLPCCPQPVDTRNHCVYYK